MPVEYDESGKPVQVEYDETGQEIVSPAEEPAGAAALRGVEAISPTPGYQRPIYIPGLGELPSAERIAEALPAGAATVASLLATRSPIVAGAAGATAGEAGRQLLRRAVGAPAATGAAQRALGLDPDSPGAAAAGLVGEATLGATGGVVTRGLDAFARAVKRSAARSVLNILQPRGAREKADALRLAEVAQRERLVPAFSGRPAQTARAERALGEAATAGRALESAGIQTGKQVEAAPVLQSAIGEIPPTLPGGGLPRTGRAERAAAQRTAEDVLEAMSGTTGQTKIPLEAAMSEKRRLDTLLSAMYERGAEQAPVGQRSIQSAANAWRGAIADSYPELGAANLRTSDLITITNMMKRALAEAERTGGAGSALQEAGAVGAGLAGRLSIPAMLGARSLVTAGPFASLSAAGKRLVAKVAAGGADTAQAWLRAADVYGLTQGFDADEIRRRRAAEQALAAQGEGVIAP